MKTIAVLLGLFLASCLFYFVSVKLGNRVGNLSNNRTKCRSRDENKLKKFNAWAKKFNKTFASAKENMRRFKIYTETDKEIEAHNADFKKALKTYFLGHNFFSDIGQDEFSANQCLKTDGRNQTPATPCGSGDQQDEPASSESIPTSVDWRPILNPIQNQGQCGACYAFTAIAAIEASALIHLGIRLKLSEQQMVDCSQNFGNHGCIGGNEAQVFDFVINNGGAGNSSVYPYVNQVTQCKRINAAVGIVGYGYVAPGDEDDLKAKVAISPVCANFDARRMKSYTGGIYYDSRCNADKRTHAVLVVGYGTEDGVDYWLIRNSYGTHWGEEGYMKLARNRGNHCGIASYATYIRE